MANNYFQFKKFRVEQEEAAMKVCTDSCLFGAWIKEPDAKTFLDIGTGTGLLSLMLAQNHTATIDAVEIDDKSYLQAKSNILNSPWNNRINIHHADILDFQNKYPHYFDVIVSNPPFFKNHLKSSDERRNQILHDDKLKFEDIVKCVNKMLKDEGVFYIMLPLWEAFEFQKLALKEDFFLVKSLMVKEKENKDIFRRFTSYSKREKPLHEEDLIIRNENNTYSSSFSSLLKDFYLHL